MEPLELWEGAGAVGPARIESLHEETARALPERVYLGTSSWSLCLDPGFASEEFVGPAWSGVRGPPRRACRLAPKG